MAIPVEAIPARGKAAHREGGSTFREHGRFYAISDARDVDPSALARERDAVGCPQSHLSLGFEAIGFTNGRFRDEVNTCP